MPINDKRIKEMEKLIDPTSFQVVCNYIDNPKTEFDRIILVEKINNLSYIAALCTENNGEDPNISMILLNNLLLEGKVKMVMTSYPKLKEGYENTVILRKDIDPKSLCYVIQLPPTYIITVDPIKKYI